MLGRTLNGLALAAAAAVSSACTVVGVRDGTEEPAYTVVGLINGAEVRRYGPRLAAEVTVGGDEVAARSAGFSPLARFIFGANEGGQKVAMTAPVSQARSEKIAMTIPVAQGRAEGGEWTIRFFMPAEYTEATLPRPKDERVRIVTVPAETYAVMRFRGSTGPDAVDAQKQRLMAALATGPWAPMAEPEAWFYDPPWTIPNLRRNEVVVRVAPRDPLNPPEPLQPPA
ncbi:MAG: heme-binding protein [Acetobacteraceae bacterium]|jgi:hypothetical protein|nr:heme-binding protein [Acetobacteraceae bacterium]